jgi:dTDP-4-dehydrorhamnose reductase
MTMRVWITGPGGQLGRALQQVAPAGVTVRLLPSAEFPLDEPAWALPLALAERPEVILHAGAWTAVDRAESEPERATAVNAGGTAALTEAARAVGARLVYVSTDYVFDGHSSTPWTVDSPAAPQSVYGMSKWQGEQAVRTLGDHGAIVRTSWVYDATGTNFVRTMLRLFGERDVVRVVADQIGTPTHADGLARAVWRAALADATGTYHWADAGVASWYDFAVAIYEEARALGLVTREVRIEPIRTEDYPTPARRPAYSVLDRTRAWQELGLPAEHWRVALRRVLRAVAHSQGLAALCASTDV